MHPGINAIVGGSDVGKTAIIRGLRWLISNRPQGDEFCSNWGGETVVTMVTGDHKISRAKIGSINAYIIDDGTPLKAIKCDVPEEVNRIIQFNEINLQRQFDRPFLIDSSPGAVAQFFNNIAHLDVIDFAISNVQRWIKGIGNTITATEEHVAKLKTALKKYKGLGKLERKLIILEALEKERNDVSDSFSNLRRTIFEITNTDVQIQKSINILKMEDGVTKLMQQIKERREVEQKHTDLIHAIKEIEFTDEQLHQGSLASGVLQEKFTREFPSVCPLCNEPKRVA